MNNAKRLVIFGATGSIGDSVLDLVRQHRFKFHIVALIAHQNSQKLAELAREFQPDWAILIDESARASFETALAGTHIQLGFGRQCALDAAHLPQDLAIHALVGMAGLPFAVESLRAGAPIALANKESLVVAGALFQDYIAKGRVFALDSEHNALFQALQGHKNPIERLTLTASGGPFWQKPHHEFARITIDQALNHPKWRMGAKISIDSATMMNKGLEVIEAHFLFGEPAHKIDVVIHPQSVIHALVHFTDGSLIAQMGCADMRIPISYILDYPNRLPNNSPRLNLTEMNKLEFYAPDDEKFPALALARGALDYGHSAPLVLNTANEVAVGLFLQGRIAFLDIANMVAQAMAQDWKSIRQDSLATILATEQMIRAQLMPN